MTLTKEDLQAIQELIAPIQTEIKEIKEDMQTLEKDIRLINNLYNKLQRVKPI